MNVEQGPKGSSVSNITVNRKSFREYFSPACQIVVPNLFHYRREPKTGCPTILGQRAVRQHPLFKGMPAVREGTRPPSAASRCCPRGRRRRHSSLRGRARSVESLGCAGGCGRGAPGAWGGAGVGRARLRTIFACRRQSSFRCRYIFPSSTVIPKPICHL